MVYAFQLVLVDSAEVIQRENRLTAGDYLVVARTAYQKAAVGAHVVRRLHYECAVVISEYFFRSQGFAVFESYLVAHSHFQYCLGNTAYARRVAGKNPAASRQAGNLVVQLFEGLACRQAFFVHLCLEQIHAAVRLLEFRRNYAVGLFGSHRERYQRRRNVNILEGSAHGVLSSYGTDFQSHLSVQSSQKGCKRLSPLLRVLAQLLEVFLERQVHVLESRSLSYQLGNRLYYGQISAVVRALLHYERIVSPRHKAASVCIAFLHGNLVYHGLYRRSLVLSAERHKYRSRSYGGVESFRQSSLGADVQVSRQLFVAFFKGTVYLLIVALRL